MKKTTKVLLILFFIFIIVWIFILVIAEMGARRDAAAAAANKTANVTANVTATTIPQYVIERPILSDWQFLLLLGVIIFIALFLIKPHWFKKKIFIEKLDLHNYWRTVFFRLMQHGELLTANSNKIIYPQNDFIKGKYYFAQVPHELRKFPESGGLPLTIVYNRDLGTIEGREPVNIVSPLTKFYAERYLIQKYIEKKKVDVPPEAMYPTEVIVRTPTGLYPGNYPYM